MSSKVSFLLKSYGCTLRIGKDLKFYPLKSKSHVLSHEVSTSFGVCVNADGPFLLSDISGMIWISFQRFQRLFSTHLPYAQEVIGTGVNYCFPLAMLPKKLL